MQKELLEGKDWSNFFFVFYISLDRYCNINE